MAGRIGIEPAGKTLRQLSVMEVGYYRQRRLEMYEQAQLVWQPKLDIGAYLFLTGVPVTQGKGKVKLPPKLDAAVDKEVERIRKEHPELPKVSF